MTTTPAPRDRHRLAVKAVTGLTVAGAATASALLVGAAASDAASSPAVNGTRSDVSSGAGHRHAAVGPGGTVTASTAQARKPHHHHHHHHHVPTSGS